jgi:hypothetical protein
MPLGTYIKNLPLQQAELRFYENGYVRLNEIKYTLRCHRALLFEMGVKRINTTRLGGNRKGFYMSFLMHKSNLPSMSVLKDFGFRNERRVRSKPISIPPTL